MSYSQLNVNEAAEYLHLSSECIEKLARSGEVAVRYVKDRPVFSKRELHDWMTQKLLGEEIESADQFHSQIGALKAADFEKDQAFLTRFLDPLTTAANLPAKTKGSVLRELVKLAAMSDSVTDDQELLKLLEEREALCSTGMVNGVALPHSRVHADYLILDSFLVVAYIPGGIPFGSQDGAMSDLFFMPCAHDDRIHLHMIARIALLLQKTKMAEKIRACDDAESMIQCMADTERDFVANI